MKKILLSLMALLLMGSMPTLALPPVNPDGTEFTDPDMHVKITKVSDGVYIVESEGPNAVANFSYLPNGDDRVNAFINAFKEGTSITFEGNFSSIDAMNNTNKGWKNVNMQKMKKQANWESSPSTPTIKEAFGQSVETVVLSDYPTSISRDAFNDLTSLKELTIGARMESIPDEFFSGKTSLQKLTFNTITENNVTYGTKKIGKKAFNACSALATVIWPSTLEEIGLDITEESVGAFQGTALSGELDLSGTNIKIIGKEAFDGCPLTSVKFNNNTLEVIGGEAFHGTQLTSVTLTNATKLRKIGYEAFEEIASLTSFSFPAGDALTEIGNDCFRKSGLTTVDMSMCEGLKKFTPKQNDGSYRQFSACTSLTSVTLPPNLEEVPGAADNALFAGCTNLNTIIFSGEAKFLKDEAGNFVLDENNRKKLANPLVIKKQAFSNIGSLQNVTFSGNLTVVEEQAFYKCDLASVDVSDCHYLTLLDKQSFAENYNLASVKLCSHPKVITGDSQNASEGPGAFFHCTAVRRVEVVGCANTDMTECICENRAFDVNITYGQTSVSNIENCATLIFPDNGYVNASSQYTSAFDYFVGDYKAGALMTQEALLAYYRDVPAKGSQETKVQLWDEDLNQYVDHKFTVTCDYQKGNGWHEFLNMDRGDIVPKGEFLRTYSRTAGDGPCILTANIITAYRAIDYKSTATGFVYDKKGKYYLTVEGASKPETERKENVDYILITSTTPASDYKGRPRYSKLTIGGKVLLKPLVPKLAYHLKDGVKTEGYTAANKDYFDDLMVNHVEELQAAPGTGRNITSYVPENTGVVLYSTGVNEDAFLMLPGYEGTDLVLTEYHHSEGRYEENRLNSENKSDNINMLQGSYGTGCGVAPCYPWIYDDQTTFSGGHYDTTQEREYRNFACVWSESTTSDGKTVKTYGWKRLKPSKLIPNRAYVSIPVGRFDNFNETADQMPDFTLEDKIVEESDANMLLLSSFDDMVMGEGEADAIKTVNTTVVNTNDDAWYTIQGVRVAQPTKGIYIHNNKKVVIK